MEWLLEQPHHATFWLFVSMAIFLMGAGKPIAKGVATMLDQRRDAVRAELEQAERLRTEAQTLLTSTQQQHAQAVEEAARIIADAKAEADALRAEAAAKLQQILSAKEAAALAKIAEAEANATRQARELATEMALAATRDLLRQKLTGASADALVDQAIADLPAKLAS